MLLLAWLLSLFWVVDCRDQTKFYGETFKMLRFSGAKTWEFLPLNKKSPIVLWRDDGTIKDSRRKSSGIYFTVYNVTQLDRGQYSLKDRNIVLSSSYLDVVERTSSYTKKSGDMFEVFFELPPDSCNIRLSLEKENHYTQHRIVTRGRLDSGMFHQDCSGYELRRPCGLVFDYIETSCTGTFTFKDGNGSVALVADLTVEGTSVDLWKIGLSCGIVSLLTSCCCCIKRCCCKKSKKDEAETPDGEAAVNLQEYDHEPVAPRSYRHDPVTLYPVVPSDAPARPSEPLVHSSPPPMPPAYSEVTSTAGTSDAPTVSFPLDSGPEPRFEVKGLNFDSPLNLNSSQSDVYTSDKLNFL